MHLKFYDAIQTTQDREVWRKSVEELLTRVDSTASALSQVSQSYT